MLSERDRHCDSGTGSGEIEQIVAIVNVVNIYLIGFIPRGRPHLRPRINERNPITVIEKPRIASYVNKRELEYAEKVFPSKVELKAIFRNSVAAITAALTPSAMVSVPRTGARL